MRTQFSTTTLLSFYQWMDNYLLQKAQAYTNHTSQLYYQPDSTLGTGYIAFSAPFKSFVWNSGVSGATMFNAVSGYFFDSSLFSGMVGTPPYTTAIFPQVSISGGSLVPLQLTLNDGSHFSIVSGAGIVSGQSIFFPDNIAQTGALRISGATSGYTDLSFIIDGTPTVIRRGDQGMITDFVNGRALIPSYLLLPNAVLSGSYSFKDFNIYFANQSAEKMVFSNTYYLNPRFSANSPSGAPPIHWNEESKSYNMVAPCIFLSNAKESNSDWALGGKYDTTFQIKASIMAESPGQLDGAISYLTDSVNSVFPQLETNTWPLNFFGDFKSGYNYQTIRDQYNTPSNQFMVTAAKGRKLSDQVKINESIFLGEVTFTVEKPRYIR